MGELFLTNIHFVFERARLERNSSHGVPRVLDGEARGGWTIDGCVIGHVSKSESWGELDT